MGSRLRVTMSKSKHKTLRCWVYRSSRKDELYLYLRKKDQFDDLPEELLRLLGRPELVMDLELHPGRKLARTTAENVLEGLRTRGYYLQMPPELKPDLYRGD